MNNKHHADRYRLGAILFILTGLIYYYLNVFAPSLIPRIFRIGMIRQPVNLLILGTDMTFNAETGKAINDINSRTDTILFVRLNPIKNRLDVISIPRDTYAPIPGDGYTKINAAHVYGGPALTVRTVSNLLGVPVDHYLEIRPDTLIKLVDQLGGVVVDVEKDMRYVDLAQGLNIDLKQGRQRLNGKQAHEFIRFRHDAFGDLGRIGRQQQFFRALKSSLNRPRNILKAPAILGVLLTSIKTDLPLTESVRLANYIRTMPLDKISPVTISGEASTVAGAGSVWVPDYASIRKMMEER